MKLLIRASGSSPLHYSITGKTINGVDFSPFVEGCKFLGSEETREAGIYSAEYVEGELQVTIGQQGLAYECKPVNGSHDWRGGAIVGADEFDNDICYITATSAPEGAEYVKRDGGWTVVVPEEDTQ